MALLTRIQYGSLFHDFVDYEAKDDLSKKLARQFDYAYRNYDYELTQRFVKDGFADFIDIDIESQKVTFIPWARREAAIQADRDYTRYQDRVDPFASPLRQSMKPGRFLRGILEDSVLQEVSSSDIEAWTNAFKAHCERNVVTVDVVRGEAVADWYSAGEDKIAGGHIGSCMQGHPREHYELYTANPDTIGLLVAIDGGGKMLGRSLVMTLDDGTVHMDYPYATRDHISTLLRNEGAKRGFVEYLDDMRGRKVPLVKTDFEFYPQTDTWYYMIDDGDGKGLYARRPEGCQWELSDRSGGRYESRKGGYYDW